MSNAKKIIEKSSPKKAREPRAKKVKVDLSKLPDAVVGGKLLVPIKGRIVFERTSSGKTALHEGYIFSIENQSATVWDETRGQFHVISLTQPVLVKAAPGQALVNDSVG